MPREIISPKCLICGTPCKRPRAKFCSLKCFGKTLERPFEDRFWSRVPEATPGECWGWAGGRGSKGYGSILRDGKFIGAHRASWIIHYGEIPDGLDVLHHCDNPSCVNPLHLFVGTHKDNMDDRDAKGRQARGDRHGFRLDPNAIPKGVQNGRSKLTDEQVRNMRTRYFNGGVTVRKLARLCGVAEQVAWKAIHRRTWRHVE
jgi:hypothetical protein